MNRLSNASTASPVRAGWPKLLAFVTLLLVLALSLAACGGSSEQTRSTGQGSASSGPLSPAQYGGQYAGGTATGDTEKGAAFARWVLEQDPQRQYITDAVVRNEQTLGVKVNPKATKSEVQQLMEALAQGMARTFPGKALTINAFYQSGDKLAEANFDPRTNRVNVQFAQ